MPDGRTIAIGDSLRPQRAGVYFWTRGGARIGAVVVNGEVEESVLQRLDDEEMRARLRPAVITHTGAATAGAAFRRASRRPLGSVLLVALLATLVVETIVAASAARVRVARGATTRAA
jgi:hypothetical protein